MKTVRCVPGSAVWTGQREKRVFAAVRMWHWWQKQCSINGKSRCWQAVAAVAQFSLAVAPWAVSTAKTGQSALARQERQWTVPICEKKWKC